MEEVQLEYGSTDISFLRSYRWKTSHKQIEQHWILLLKTRLVLLLIAVLSKVIKMYKATAENQ